MEMAFQLHRPPSCKWETMGSPGLRIRKTIGTLSNLFESKGITTLRTMAPMCASFGNLWSVECRDSGYERRRPRKNSVPKTNISSPKGFAPKRQGRRTLKKDRDSQVEQSGSSQSNKNFSSSNRFSEASADRKRESSHFGSAPTISGIVVKSRTKPSEEGDSQDVGDIKLAEELSEDENDRKEVGTIMHEDTILNGAENFVVGRTRIAPSITVQNLSEFLGSSDLSTNDKGRLEKSVFSDSHTTALHNKEDDVAMVEVDISREQFDTRGEFHTESFAQRMELEAHAHRKLLDYIAKENVTDRKPVFVYPMIIKADQVVEVFFNRSLSLLVNETDIFIKGAFNDWRWKDFTEKMHTCDLEGDWWSCRIYVPKQAYKMDFVFFNGGNVYENNNLKNFSHSVEGEMDEYTFKDFLLEEERKKLEKLAAEQAERERQAEEQRHREIELAAMDADRAQAKVEVETRRKSCQIAMALSVDSIDGLWHREYALSKIKNMFKLCYNRRSRPLENSSNIWIHGGYNNWLEGLSIVVRLKKYEEKGGDWWYADVTVPERALVLDWVFADGPPQQAKIYDNNHHQDFHAALTKDLSEEMYWEEEENMLFQRLRKERKQKQEAALKKAEKMARLKSDTKERTLKRFLLSQKNVVYTEPLDVYAGKMVRILYSPINTVLNGKKEVWFKCSFNRWTHQDGPLPPQKMTPVGNGTHLQANISVPNNAYTMDFVFSEREDGGVHDNNNGMDYHISVIGGNTREAPMHIVHVAVEMAPIAKVGGLGDVVTGLSRAVQDLGHKVDIIVPKYDCLNFNHVKDFHYHQTFVWCKTEIKVWQGRVEGLSVYFLEPQNGMFWVGCVYGRNNDSDRFAFFCHAALEFLLRSGIHPNILHCHDWSSAPVAWLFKEYYTQSGLGNARVIFTIHNLEFGIHQIGKAMIHTDRATTVSHTYSREVSQSPVISPHLYKFHGIVNGIDSDIWDPFNDNVIPVCYTSENVIEGKKAAKAALQQRLGLEKSDHPLVGIITRLTVQKGIHLIKHAIWQTLERNGQVVLLGSAPDPRIQNEFVNLAKQLHSSRSSCVRFCLTYDEPLSHLIYAGADFILVPSIFEPCGLTQLVAMRYGSIPVVRKTGGLYDTVFDVDDDQERAQLLGLEPNGFSFVGADPGGVDYALNRAISTWYDRREWLNQLCKRVMEQDWSWNRPALDYIQLYHAAHK